MSPRTPKRIRFQLGITTGFILLIVPSITGIMYFVYSRNTDASTKLADDFIIQTSKATIQHSIDFLETVGDSVDTLAAIGDQQPDGLRHAGVLQVLLRTVRNEPQIYSLYVGFESDGAFNEVVRLPPGLQEFGPNKTPVPAGAVYVKRQLQRPENGPATDHYTYIGEDDQVLLEEDAKKASYDPRKREWFEQATRTPNQRTVSELNPSASTGKPVLTLAHAFRTADGKVAGVVGSNITLDNLSDFLSRNTPGKHGLAIIFDDEGNLVAHPDAQKVVRKTDQGIVVTKIADLADTPQVTAAIEDHNHRTKTSKRRTFQAADGREYIASITAFPESFGKRWDLLIVVPTEDFIGEIKRTSRDMLLLGLGVLVVGVVGIRWMSAAFTEPIQRLIAETERIKQFDLDGEVRLSTRISEIAQLADAMQTMKTALRSFGRFVPKTLVRELVTSGKGLGLGGESRRITVMFSDLANVSSLAEKITPRALTERVSDYLEDVSRMVIRHQGTIDKYIGDAVMALWNAPLTDEKHMEHACSAALDAVEAFNASNARWAEKGWAPLGMRVGMHSDQAIVGVIGSTEHMSYTALGDGVNIASRLEGINKSYGTTICVSHTIYTAVSDRFLMRPLDFVAVKGRKEPILIYELMGRLVDESEPARSATPAQRELAALTTTAFQAWTTQDYGQAHALYTAVLERFPRDSVALLYARKCAEAQLQPVAG